MNKWWTRVGMWWLQKSSAQVITCALADGTPHVLVIVAQPSLLVPGMIVGAMQTWCLANGVPVPPLDDVVVAPAVGDVVH